MGSFSRLEYELTRGAADTVVTLGGRYGARMCAVVRAGIGGAAIICGGIGIPIAETIGGAVEMLCTIEDGKQNVPPRPM